MIAKDIKILIDFAIGDGYIGDTKESPNSATLSISHSITQLAYCEHKASRLRDYEYNANVRIEKRTSGYGKHKDVCRFAFSHKNCKTAQKHLYNKRVKTIDKGLLRYLDRESLAYWFMDDGCLDQRSTLRHKDSVFIYETPHTSQYKFFTNSFTIPEAYLIVEWLKEKFNIIARVNITSANQPIVNIARKESKDIFRHLISDFVIPEMQYKIMYPHTAKGLPYRTITKEEYANLR